MSDYVSILVWETIWEITDYNGQCCFAFRPTDGLLFQYLSNAATPENVMSLSVTLLHFSDCPILHKIGKGQINHVPVCHGDTEAMTET